jgi:hypothetical protein
LVDQCLFFKGATQHHCDDVIFRESLYRSGVNSFAIAQNSDPIRDAEDFAQTMRNIKNSDSSLLQFLDDCKKPRYFSGIQRCCRFIQDWTSSFSGRLALKPQIMPVFVRARIRWLYPRP